MAGHIEVPFSLSRFQSGHLACNGGLKMEQCYCETTWDYRFELYISQGRVSLISCWASGHIPSILILCPHGNGFSPVQDHRVIGITLSRDGARSNAPRTAEDIIPQDCEAQSPRTMNPCQTTLPFPPTIGNMAALVALINVRSADGCMMHADCPPKTDAR